MAVVRQNTQVFNQPIGVVRANAGASEIGAAISQAAGRASDLIYREGAIRAEEVGKKAGIAQPASKIVAINPSTGLPEAYAAPTGFGRIASRSYQSMIDRRFEDSVLDEMKMRGQEIAADAGSADEFRTRMTSYVEQMYANAVDEGGQLNAYGRLIEQAGTAYVSSTFTALRNREIAAAKEALERQQKYALWVQDRQITAAINAGATFQDVMTLVDDKRQRAQDLFASGAKGFSFSTFESQMRDADGFAALAASRELVTAFVGMNELQRSQLKANITNPSTLNQLGSQVNIPNLSRIVNLALADTSPLNLVSSLDSFADVRGEFVESAVDSALDGFNANATTTSVQIASHAATLPPEIQQDFMAEASAQTVLAVAGDQIDTVENLDLVTNELRKFDGVDQSVLVAAVGQDATNLIMSMPPEVRGALAESLNARRSALNAIGAMAEKGVENAFGQDIRALQGSSNVSADLALLTGNINGSTLDEAAKRRLVDVATSEASAELISRAQNTGVSTMEMDAIRDAVRSGDPLVNASPQAQAAFDLYKEAYSLQPATTDGEMGRRLEGLASSARKDAQRVQLNAVLSQATSGDQPTPEGMKLIDDSVLKGVNSIIDLVQNPDAMRIMNSGILTPKMSALFESALGSSNDDVLTTALGLFESYSAVTAISRRGEVIELDFMRRNLSQESYAMYAAASYAKSIGISSEVAIASLRDYEGGLAGIDEDLKRALDIGKDRPLSSALVDKEPMSPAYQAEVISMMRVLQANGQTVNSATIDGWINDYQKKSKRDDSIVGSRVGDETVYALTNFFSQAEITSNQGALVDAMAQDPRLATMIKGGTSADEALAVLRDVLGFNLVAQGESVVEAFTGGWDATAGQEMERRLRRGLSAINFDIRYKPDEALHRVGVPSYYVGYEDNGIFKVIEIGGEPFRLTKAPPTSGTKTSIAFNTLIIAKNSNADSSVIAEKTIEYYATLPHMTESILSSLPDYSTLNSALPNMNALEVYRKAGGAK